MSRLESPLPPDFLQQLSGFQETPGPFGPIAAPFQQKEAESALFDALIGELLAQQQPDIRPAPELGTFQLLNAEFDRRFPREPARHEVEFLWRQLGRPIPGPQSPEDELAAFEAEIAVYRNDPGKRDRRESLIQTIITQRTREEQDRLGGARFGVAPGVGRVLAPGEEAQLRRFFAQATDEQLAQAAGLSTERRQEQQTLQQNLAVRLPVQSAARLGRRGMDLATFGASEALITAGPTGANPLPRMMGEDVFGEDILGGTDILGTDIVGPAFEQNVVGGTLEFAVEMIGAIRSLGVTGLARLASLVAARLGVKKNIAKRAIEGAVMMGVGEAGSQVIKVPIEIAINNKPAERAAIEALQDIGAMTAGGTVTVGAVGAVESGVRRVIRAVRAVRQPQGVRTPLREPLPPDPPIVTHGPVTPIPVPEPPTTVTRLGSQLPAPEPVTPPQRPPVRVSGSVGPSVSNRLTDPRTPGPPDPRTPGPPDPLTLGPTDPLTSLGVQATRARQPGPRAIAAPAEPAVPRETPTLQPIPQGELPRAQPHAIRTPQEATARPGSPARPPETTTPGRATPGSPGPGRPPAPPTAPLPEPAAAAEAVQPAAAGEVARPPVIEESAAAIQRPAGPKIAPGGSAWEVLWADQRGVQRFRDLDDALAFARQPGRDADIPRFVSAQGRIREIGDVPPPERAILPDVARGEVIEPSPPTRQPGKPFAGTKVQPAPTATVIEPIPGIVRPGGPPAKPPAGAAKPPAKPPASELSPTDEGRDFAKLAGKFLGELNAGVPVDKLLPVIRTELGQKAIRWGTYVPGYHIYARPLIRIVERQGGNTGKLLARIARRFADRAREFEGRVAPTRLAIEVRFRAKIKERNRLQQFTRAQNSNDSFHAKTQLIIENRSVPDGPDQVFWEQGYRRLLVITGKMAEEVGAQVFTKGGGSRPFKRAMQANKFIRIATPQFREAMFTHDNLFEKVVDELLLVNGMKKSEREVVMEFLDQWNGPRAERVVGAIERARVFDVFPTHVRHNGKIVPILETDPVRSLAGPAGFIPDRAAFIDSFGNNFGENSALSRLRLQFARDGGRIRDFDNLIAAMHDRPIGLFGGQPQRLVTQNMPLHWRLMIAGLNPIWRGFVLSGSVIPNMTEVIAKVPAHAGARRMLRTLVVMARNPVKNKRELLAAGSITADTMDFMIQETRKIEDVGRIGIEGLTRLFLSKFQNEFNEQFAATAGKMLRDDLERGAMTFLDRQRLFILDYTPTEVRAFTRGTASKRLLDSIPGRIAAATQGTTRKRVERSLAANNPLFKFGFDFQSYQMITLERGGRVLRNLPEAYARGGVKELAAATIIAAQFFAGQAIAGIGSLMLRGLIFGGAFVFGPRIVDWIYEGLLESGMAGPLRTLQWVNPGQSLSDIAFKFSAKGRLFNDLYDMFTDQRGFANRLWAEKVVEILRRQVPAHRAAAPVLTMTQSAYFVAIGLRDPELARARSRYFDWTRKHLPRVAGKTPGFNKFRREMGNAVTWLRAGREKKSFDALTAAFRAAIEEETGSIPEGLDVPSLNAVSKTVRSKIRSSIMAQRLLQRVPKRLHAKLRKDIGERNFQLLEIEDLILKYFAQGKFVQKSERQAARAPLKKAG